MGIAGETLCHNHGALVKVSIGPDRLIIGRFTYENPKKRAAGKMARKAVTRLSGRCLALRSLPWRKKTVFPL